jgi:hypothetical protein
VSAVSTVQSVMYDIENFIRQCGGPYPAWYCGVAADPRRRLFIDHNVNPAIGPWIHRHLGTDTEARWVEQYFLNMGCKGGPGGGDFASRFVYAYQITSSTVE